MSHASQPARAGGIVTRHLRITGRVQGVFYRASMVEQARQLGVKGWVRNRLDGSVEAMVQGPADAVQALVDWAWKGPPRARVEDVQVRSAVADEVYTDFTQRSTTG
jgi:acylphosphatase